MLEAIPEGPEGIVLLQHAVGIHEPVPSPWGEGQGEGTRVCDAAHFGQIERLARFADKREGGISLPLLFSTVISGV